MFASPDHALNFFQKENSSQFDGKKFISGNGNEISNKFLIGCFKSVSRKNRRRCLNIFFNRLQLSELTGMYDDIQDRIWEMEKSWRNNLIFHGVRYDDPNVEEDPNRTEEKVRTVIKVDLQISRDIPILRAYRIRNGPLVKGTHPILGWLLV